MAVEGRELKQSMTGDSQYHIVSEETYCAETNKADVAQYLLRRSIKESRNITWKGRNGREYSVRGKSNQHSLGQGGQKKQENCQEKPQEKNGGKVEENSKVMTKKGRQTL